ncbi:glyoxalase [Neobacillus sp. MER 74]|uniref:VOC family protein n=1 Tax=unclassified Neobacillus TaxID=2675272 RepID=UPI00203DED47|nr:VOC family protein [Neobacillus sp. MER 74]MCM3117040.1 glyoxalase [Neobacillus sp. MER 74]
MKVLGFGGIFWRSKNIETLKKWYNDVLGIPMDNDWNMTIITPGAENKTAFSFFTEDNEYFPQEQSVMLNFQIDNMAECLEHLNQCGVPLLKEPEQSEFGTFIWISDPEGRWIELWEKPTDVQEKS